MFARCQSPYALFEIVAAMRALKLNHGASLFAIRAFRSTDRSPAGFRAADRRTGNRKFLSWVLADVASNEKALRLRRDELESRLLAVPAANWRQGAEKAGYQLNLFAATLAAQDSRKQNLVTAALADFKRLLGQS